MFENDYPLLSTPSLTALILQLGEAGDITLDACMTRFAALLAAAHEPPSLPSEAIRERFATHLRQLEIARLAEPVATGMWRLTDRGREALRLNPGGVDPSILIRYPEYAAHIRARAHRSGTMDPRTGCYDEGYEARRRGLPYTANPNAFFTADFLSWEYGWMEALDES